MTKKKASGKPGWKPAAGKKWRDALTREHASHGKVILISAALRKPGGPKSLVVPSPRAVDARVRKVRKGSILTLGVLRADLARGTAAEIACPMTTGIFLRIVAEAAEEDRRDGRKRIAPYWRVVRNDGALIENFPGGVSAQAVKLRAEGHAVERGKVVPAPRA